MEKNCEGFLYWSLSTIFDVDYFQIDLRRLFVAEKIFCRLPFPSTFYLWESMANNPGMGDQLQKCLACPVPAPVGLT